MGVVIQFESHKSELPHVRQREHDLAVLEYYDQPPQIKLDFEGPNGKRISFWHTPDFFVLQTHAAGWEECKVEEDLIRLAVSQPNRYCRDEDGVWRCPPGEEYAERFGLYYRVCSSSEVNWTYQRNLEFLEDYFRNNSRAVEGAARDVVLSVVASEPGVKLEKLFQSVEESASRDDVQMLIATDEIFVDLYRYDITHPDRARVYPDRDTALAYGQVIEARPTERTAVRFVSLRVGATVVWNGVGWKIANVGSDLVGLVGDGSAYSEVPRVTFEELVKEGKIVGGEEQGARGLPPEAEKIFLSASRAALAEANRRAELTKAWKNGVLEPDVTVPERTLRFWQSQWEAAEVKYGNGYIGLLPKPLPGNRGDKLPPAARELLNIFIEQDYETHKQKGKFAVYAAYQKACDAKGIEPASYKTFSRAARMRPAYEQTLKRQGRRAAYKFKDFYWELDYTTPRHGDHPLHIAHIDHTQLDVELVCSATGKNLGRPWLTVLLDAYARRFLGLYLTLDAPSYRSCMMALRDCVSRYKRLPQTLVTDGGREFGSIYLETLLAFFECTKKERPPAQSRVGSVGERIFGTLNSQFIHTLRGNTQVMRQVRQVTKSVNPKPKAVWSLRTLYDFLCEYAFNVYDTAEHRTLGQSPRDAYATGMARGGHRAHRLIPYDETFRMLTMPTTRKGTAWVEPGRGVKVNNIYYWAESFRDPHVERSSVPVRYDPWDASTAFAFVRGQWVGCLSQYYKEFRGRSERELMLATAALHKRHSRDTATFQLTAKRLADFLASADAEEELLAQRLADMEGQGIRAAIDGGGPGLLQSAEPPATSGQHADESAIRGADEDSTGAEEPEEYEAF